MIGIVDYGMGSLGSVQNMLARLGLDSLVSSSPEELEAADRLIMPGIGAFDEGMQRLEELRLVPFLQRRVGQQGVPLLGICLGLQLLTAGSEEGSRPGLGLLPGRTVRFRLGPETGAKIPHMGWNRARLVTARPPLAGVAGLDRFYFVHSYYVECQDPLDVAMTTVHGGLEFASACCRGNLLGVQFHPEKSHRHGMALLAAFAQF